MTNFYTLVYQQVKRIPRGKVATYGSIASRMGSPRAARMVGMALRKLPEATDVPWHRVINSRGEISIENMDHPAMEQMRLLQDEGVAVRHDGVRYRVDLEKYFWRE